MKLVFEMFPRGNVAVLPEVRDSCAVARDWRVMQFQHASIQEADLLANRSPPGLLQLLEARQGGVQSLRQPISFHACQRLRRRIQLKQPAECFVSHLYSSVIGLDEHRVAHVRDHLFRIRGDMLGWLRARHAAMISDVAGCR